MRLKFWDKEIDNSFIRDNFKRLSESIKLDPLLKSEFSFFEITAPSAVTKSKFPHNFTYRPRDVILTAVSEGANVTFHTDLFDLSNIVFTTSAACTFRCFIGTYREGILK